MLSHGPQRHRDRERQESRGRKKDQRPHVNWHLQGLLGRRWFDPQRGVPRIDGKLRLRGSEFQPGSRSQLPTDEGVAERGVGPRVRWPDAMEQRETPKHTHE